MRLPKMKSRVLPTSSMNMNRSDRKPIRFNSNKNDKRFEKKRVGAFGWCCTSTNGLTKLGLFLSILGVLFLVAIAAIIPLIFILKNNSGSNTNTNNISSGSNTNTNNTGSNTNANNTGSNTNKNNTSASTSNINVPKLLGIYYGSPSLVQNASGNLSEAIDIFNQFDLIVFGDGIASPSHDDYNNTQIIIQALNNSGKLTFGYVDLGVTTQNLSISEMQIIVDDWTAMGVQGIMWDNAGFDYNVTRSRQNTMISYCHSLNLSLRVMMNASDPDDVMSGTPMILNSQDFYLLDSYLIKDNIYQNLTLWKIKADKCLAYSNIYRISMACLSTTSGSLLSNFSDTQQFSQAWFGTAIYNFNYFQATDTQYSTLYAFDNPISYYGNNWQTDYVQTDSINHYYRSTESYTLQIYGDGINYGSGNYTILSNG